MDSSPGGKGLGLVGSVRKKKAADDTISLSGTQRRGSMDSTHGGHCKIDAVTSLISVFILPIFIFYLLLCS